MSIIPDKENARVALSPEKKIRIERTDRTTSQKVKFPTEHGPSVNPGRFDVQLSGSSVKASCDSPVREQDAHNVKEDGALHAHSRRSSRVQSMILQFEQLPADVQVLPLSTRQAQIKDRTTPDEQTVNSSNPAPTPPTTQTRNHVAAQVPTHATHTRTHSLRPSIPPHLEQKKVANTETQLELEYMRAKSVAAKGRSVLERARVLSTMGVCGDETAKATLGGCWREKPKAGVIDPTGQTEPDHEESTVSLRAMAILHRIRSERAAS